MKTVLHQLKTRVQMTRHRRRTSRCLEIGPGRHALPGFETLSIVPGRWVDYVHDAASNLPFDDNTFDLIYASHVLEHIPWYQTLDTLREWRRVLTPQGRLEVWVPDGLKICSAFVDAENGDADPLEHDDWRRLNPEGDPCAWAAGRLFTYGDGKGTLAHPNWHRALFSPRRLKQLFEQAGFVNIRIMDRAEVRGTDHGWINLGICGDKQ